MHVHIFTHLWTYTNTRVCGHTHYLAHSKKEKYQGTKDQPKVGTWEGGGSDMVELCLGNLYFACKEVTIRGSTHML